MKLQACRVGVASLALLIGHAAFAATRGHAVDELLLPTSGAQASARAIDLDGDAGPENQFGSVLAVMVTNLEFDIPQMTQQSVLAGSIVHLVEVSSVDPAFSNDPAAAATWYVGKPTAAPPAFDGTDLFEFDPAVDSARFVAPLANGAFVSANPVTARPPAVLAVGIRVGSQVVTLSLWGARLAFTVDANGLSTGQVNGAILQEEMDNVFVPALALAFDEIVHDEPGSDRAMALLDLFDDAPMDGSITVPEVAGDELMASLLAPDLDLFDPNGGYAPNPNGSTPDAMSFGFGFTAVATPARLPQIFADGFE